MRNSLFTATLFCAAFSASAFAAADQAAVTKQYGDVSQKIVAAALADDHATARLQYLCDRIGNRLSGSASLEVAVRWAAAEMEKAGLLNVQTPPVQVPYWVRGRESAMMLEPLKKPITMLGFGMVPGTPAEGITANVLPVTGVPQLKTIAKADVAGKLVLFNSGRVDSPEYKLTTEEGPALAASMGAAGVLVVNSFPFHSPATGALKYPDGAQKIPAAAITVEDGEMMARIVNSGTPVRVQLKMEAHMMPDATSHDVMGELRGSEKPEEIVLMGGHIDSWDVGQGANDNGSGMMASLEALLLIKKLGLKPRRTIRVVFWTNEENGHGGSRAYADFVGPAAVRNHIAAFEDDHGVEKPTGFGFGAVNQEALTPTAWKRASEIGWLAEINGGGGKILPRGSGGDIKPLCDQGAACFKVSTVNQLYDQYHHTNSDSFEKIVLRDFQLHVASLAVMSYIIADMPERLRDLK